MKKITIITATKNRSLLLENNIRSVFSQKAVTIQQVIVNNGEEKSVFDVIDRCNLTVGSQIIVVNMKEGVLPAQIRNKGLQYVAGDSEFVKFLDDDDMLADRTSLSKLVGVLENRATSVCVYARQRRIDADGNEINITDQGPLGLGYILDNSSFPFSSTLFRKEFLMELVGMNEWVSSEDLELMCRAFILASVKGLTIEYLDEVVTCYRKHAGSVLSTNKANGEKDKATAKLRGKFQQLLELSKFDYATN